MGCTASTPNFTNQCSDALGARYEIPGFCSKAGSSGTADRANACTLLSGPLLSVAEWGEEAQGTACSFSSGTNNKCTSSGGVVGVGASCQRIAFLADQLTCCNQNSVVQGTAQCFVGAKTCAPDYRGPTRAGCRALYPTSCVVGNPPGTNPAAAGTWTANFIGDTPCVVAIRENSRVAGGLTSAQAIMTAVFNRYKQDGFIIGTRPGQVGYNTFQERLLELARLYPGAASTVLRASVCNTLSRGDLGNSLALTQFCGCYLPTSQYVTTLNQLGSGIQCDPLCNISTTVPLTDAQGNVIRCTNTICVIDNVSINLASSQSGNLSFNQLCGSCGVGSACTCSIVNVDINATNSTIGNINFQQSCGQSACYRTGPDGSLLEIPCYGTTGDQQNQENSEAADRQDTVNEQQSNRALRITFIVIGVAVAVLFLLGLLLFIFKAK